MEGMEKKERTRRKARRGKVNSNGRDGEERKNEERS